MEVRRQVSCQPFAFSDVLILHLLPTEILEGEWQFCLTHQTRSLSSSIICLGNEKWIIGRWQKWGAPRASAIRIQNNAFPINSHTQFNLKHLHSKIATWFLMNYLLVISVKIIRCMMHEMMMSNWYNVKNTSFNNSERENMNHYIILSQSFCS